MIFASNHRIVMLYSVESRKVAMENVIHMDSVEVFLSHFSAWQLNIHNQDPPVHGGRGGDQAKSVEKYSEGDRDFDTR